MKRFLALILALLMVISMVACGSNQKAETAAPETAPSDTAGSSAQSADGPSKRLTIAWKAVTSRLDPMYISDQEGFTYAYMVYDCLVESDHQGNYEPALATEWSVADDGMTWTFKLREGVKFQNGQDFTSADVVCSYQRILDDPSCNMYIDHWSMLESVKAVDDYTVEIKTKEPFALFLASVGWTWIIPHEAYEQYGADMFSAHSDVPYGTGPWQLAEYNEGQNWVLTKYEGCWKENTSYYDEVEMRALSEVTTAISAHLSGDVQINVNTSTDLLSMYSGSEDKIEIRVEDKAAVFFYTQVNCSEGEPFSDPNLRLAYDYAIDRKTIVEGIYGELGGDIPNGVWCTSTYGFDADYPAYEYNPEKAKEYLEQSSYDGRQLVLNVKTTEIFAQEVGLAIAENLNAVGFNVVVEPVEAATMNTIRADGDYDIFMVTQIHADGDAFSHLNKRILLDAHNSHYVNEELNALIEASNKELDEEKRIEQLNQINAIMREDPASQSSIVQYFQTVANDIGIVNLPVYPDNVHYYRYVTYES